MRKYVSIYKESVLLLNENKKILDNEEMRRSINKYDLLNETTFEVDYYDENNNITKNKDEMAKCYYSITHYNGQLRIANDKKYVWSNNIDIPVKRNTLSNDLQDVYDKLLKLKKDLDKNYIYKVSKTSRTSKVKNNVINKFKKNKLTRQIIVNDINNGKIINDAFTIYDNVKDDDDYESFKDFICNINFNSLGKGFKEVYDTFKKGSTTPIEREFLEAVEIVYKTRHCKDVWKTNLSDIHN